MYDIMFAHHAPAYIVTRKWHVLKVTPQVATPGAESAVYDSLVLGMKAFVCFFCNSQQIQAWSENVHEDVCGVLLHSVYWNSLFIVSEQLMEPLVNFDIKWQVCS